MRSLISMRSFALLFVFALFAGACAAEEEAATDATEAMEDEAEEAMDEEAMDEEAMDEMEETEGAMDEEAMEEGAMEEEAMEEEAMDEMEETEGAMEEDAMEEEAMEETDVSDSAAACDADSIVALVEGGADEGTLAGMTDDPVATAASNNPVLTTLATAVDAAGLGDTLNSAEALTVFAPTDCAFAEFDPATLEAALADPQGLLTTVLGYHVIAGEQIGSDNIAGDFTTFTEEALTVEGTTVAGQAEIVVPDIETANATVHLIDTVMVPPSVSGE